MPVFGWMAHDRPGYYHAIWRARRHSYSATAIVARHEEHVEDVLVNVLYARALLALGGRFATRAQRIVQALLERSWDPDVALFWDLAGGAERPIRVSTWSSLAPLALPGIPAEVKRALVERQLLHPRRHRAATGIPSVGDQRADIQPALGPLPLLARAVVDGHGVAAGAAAARARLRRGSRPRRELARARRAPVRAAQYYDPLTVTGSARGGSRCPRSSSTSSLNLDSRLRFAALRRFRRPARVSGALLLGRTRSGRPRTGFPRVA